MARLTRPIKGIFRQSKDLHQSMCETWAENDLYLCVSRGPPIKKQLVDIPRNYLILDSIQDTCITIMEGNYTWVNKRQHDLTACYPPIKRWVGRFSLLATKVRVSINLSDMPSTQLFHPYLCPHQAAEGLYAASRSPCAEKFRIQPVSTPYLRRNAILAIFDYVIITHEQISVFLLDRRLGIQQAIHTLSISARLWGDCLGHSILQFIIASSFAAFHAARKFLATWTDLTATSRAAKWANSQTRSASGYFFVTSIS